MQWGPEGLQTDDGIRQHAIAMVAKGIATITTAGNAGSVEFSTLCMITIAWILSNRSIDGETPTNVLNGACCNMPFPVVIHSIQNSLCPWILHFPVHLLRR